MPTNSVLGSSSEASIDQVNIWMRSTPWYQQQMRAWGQDPGHPTLTETQSEQIKKLAQANGVVVDEGNVELDDHGNFNPIGHKLRNTLLVGGIAAATIATMGAAGVFSSAAAGGGAAASGGGALASTITAPTVGALAPGLASGTSYAGILAAGAGGGGAAAAGSGLGSSLLRYGLPTAGNLVGGLIQAKTASDASAEERKYLDEALAYEKEYGTSSAYSRQQDAADRQLAANKVTLEAQRYGDYQGRIAPWIANGTSSNDRMAALLGLAPRSGGSSGGSSSGGSSMSGDPTQYADQLSAADKLKVDALLKASNSNDNPAYWYGVNAQHGGFDATGADWNQRRISTGDGVGKGYTGPSTPSPTTPPVPGATPPYLTTQPQARSADVQMRAPDGSVKTVSADQVDHYKALGATVLGATG